MNQVDEDWDSAVTLTHRNHERLQAEGVQRLFTIALTDPASTTAVVAELRQFIDRNRRPGPGPRLPTQAVCAAWTALWQLDVGHARKALVAYEIAATAFVCTEVTAVQILLRHGVPTGSRIACGLLLLALVAAAALTAKVWEPALSLHRAVLAIPRRGPARVVALIAYLTVLGNLATVLLTPSPWQGALTLVLALLGVAGAWLLWVRHAPLKA